MVGTLAGAAAGGGMMDLATALLAVGCGVAVVGLPMVYGLYRLTFWLERRREGE